MIRINDYMIVENEHLYGPGKRLLLFLQGCSIHCEGCINQHLWSFEDGTLISTNKILEICNKENVEGITIHGGEPLDQADGLLELVRLIKKDNYNIILFTGYTKKELSGSQLKVWNCSDIVVAGRFVLKKRNVNLQFRGSTNQKVYTHKGPFQNYKVNDGYTTAILTIDDNGYIGINGFYTEDIDKLVNND